MNVAQINAADKLARKRFTYRPEKGDTWRSFADEVLRGEAWFGDCDDLASTVMDLLARQGVPLADMFRLVVESKGKTPDHLCACVRADLQAFRIVGDTFGPAYDAVRLKHRGIFTNRMSETNPAIWREGVPWQAQGTAP